LIEQQLLPTSSNKGYFRHRLQQSEFLSKTAVDIMNIRTCAYLCVGKTVLMMHIALLRLEIPTTNI